MYIDPNFGGMLFQVLAVVFGVLSGTVLMFAGKIKMGIAKFRRSRRQKDGENETSNESEK
ncbi:MAG: hypothetical protein C4583_08780 [Anaerolineaceae bacterium]|jgi:hypothetical protein|nr:MAG: hypothetical protein C4583_08780 [Anaerolineaceae bacterium]